MFDSKKEKLTKELIESFKRSDSINTELIDAYKEQIENHKQLEDFYRTCIEEYKSCNKLIIRQVKQAVEIEPEYPGPMTDELWEVFKNNRDILELAFKSTVSETKQNILERLNKIFDDSQ